VIRLRCWSFEGTWLDEIEKLSETKNMEKQLIAQEEEQESCTVLGIHIQWLTDKKKQEDERLVRILQRKKEVSDNLNMLKQKYVFK
jgi:hypothetical protein